MPPFPPPNDCRIYPPTNGVFRAYCGNRLVKESSSFEEVHRAALAAAHVTKVGLWVRSVGWEQVFPCEKEIPDEVSDVENRTTAQSYKGLKIVESAGEK